MGSHAATTDLKVALNDYSTDNQLGKWMYKNKTGTITPSIYKMIVGVPEDGTLIYPFNAKRWEGTTIPILYEAGNTPFCKWHIRTPAGTNIEIDGDAFIMPGNTVFVDALCHSLAHAEALAPTCTTEGNVEYWYCSQCEKYFLDEACTVETTHDAAVLPVDPQAHDLAHTEAVAATCLTAGNYEYWYCERCGHYYLDEACTQQTTKEGTVEAALGHTYDNGFCVRCNSYEKPEKVDGYYEIWNAGQLYWFGDRQHDVNNHNFHARLMADIVVNTGVLKNGRLNDDADAVAALRPWKSMGANSINAYAGTFDGNGHSISGLYVSSTNGHQGFVGYGHSTTVIKDLTLLDMYVKGGSCIGGVAGDIPGKIIGCTVQACVESTSADAGVLAGYCTGTITGCHSMGYVSGTTSIGGIAGYMSGSITDCTNDADVYGTRDGVGGIAGHLYYATETTSGCINNGNVTLTADKSYDNNIWGLGGIIGHNESTVSKCINNGAVLMEGFGKDIIRFYAAGAGGIVGHNRQGVIDNCCNTGTVTIADKASLAAGIAGSAYENSVVKNCYNIGAIRGDKYVGSIVANSPYHSLINNHYLRGTAIDDNQVVHNGTGTAGTTPVADDETKVKGWDDFSTGAVCYALNGSTSEGELAWYQTLGTQVRPMFEGLTVYYDAARGIYTNTEPGTEVFPQGDVNGDGSVDVSDVTALVAVILNTVSRESLGGNCDVNGDGDVDVSDVTALVAIILAQ